MWRARSNCTSLARRAPTAAAYAFLGWAYSFQQRDEEAIAQRKRAIAVDPTFGNPYNDIGCYLMGAGRERRATPGLLRATSAPRYAAPPAPQPGAYPPAQGRVLAAMKECGRALELEPCDATARAAPRRLQTGVN